MAKLLIVDDELGIRTLCYELFTKDGHEVVTVPRGDQAMSAAGLETLDLVLMDINIPGEDGLSLLKKLRAKKPRLPIAVFSGMITAEIEKEAYEAGAIEVIDKGSGATDLKEKITRILAAKQRLFNQPAETPRQEKILIVDDEEPVRGLLMEFFKHKGFKTIGARNGEEAVTLVKTEQPSVVLLDVMMPGMDGIMTLKKIREVAPKIGVVMATAVQDEGIAREAMALGAYHYVLKPFDLQYLELVVLTRLVIAS